MDPKIAQQLADAISSLATTQAMLGYAFIVLAVGTLVCLGLLVRMTSDIHAQTSALLKRSTP